jgi:hypothetical protein
MKPAEVPNFVDSEPANEAPASDRFDRRLCARVTDDPGSVAPRLTVAFDGALPFDLAAICLSSHGPGVGPAADIPGGSGNGSQAGDHCAMCVSSAPPLLAPPESIRIAIDFATSAEPITPTSPVVPLSNPASRQGGARAPPTMA